MSGAPRAGRGPAWLERLGLELSRPDSFDEGVEAARNACAAGASLAAAVITAGAYYDNPLTGAPALRACLERLTPLPLELGAWQRAFASEPQPEAGGAVMAPGFGFVAPGREHVFWAALRRLVSDEPSAVRGQFLLEHQLAFGEAGPLNAAGLCALVFSDHDVDLETAERTFWSLKIDVALRQAQRARRAGVAAIPFAGVRYVYEGDLPAPRQRDRAALLRRLGLDRPEDVARREPHDDGDGAAPETIGEFAHASAEQPSGGRS
jgi:hypothetical protein